MDVALVIRHRLQELGLEQKDLAAAAQVTESYISQLLARKKVPPAPGRTDIYAKIGKFLKLREGELSRLAAVERQEYLRKKVADPPPPLFKDCRELILRKCETSRRKEVRAIFEKEPFGELERLVTQKLLDVGKRVAREGLDSNEWLRVMAKRSGRGHKAMRAVVLEFLDTEIVGVSVDSSVHVLEPLIERWGIDLNTFDVEITLNRKLAGSSRKRFEFVEREPEPEQFDEPGLAEFLSDRGLSGDASEEELEFLKALKFRDRRPTALYFYRELQNLRDPLHFRAR